MHIFPHLNYTSARYRIAGRFCSHSRRRSFSARRIMSRTWIDFSFEDISCTICLLEFETFDFFLYSTAFIFLHEDVIIVDFIQNLFAGKDPSASQEFALWIAVTAHFVSAKWEVVRWYWCLIFGELF